MERLIIKKFAGIKSLEIDLTQINVLIGPQASGKSITAKLFYYFKSFFSEIRKGVESESSKRDIDTEHLNKFMTYFPKESWSDEDFSIEYYINKTVMSVKRFNGKTVKFEYSDDIKNIIRTARTILKKEKERLKKTKSIRSFELSHNFSQKFNELLKAEVSGCSMFNQIFIPAGRSFFSNVQASIFSFLSSNKSLDPFLIEFGSFYESFKRFSTDDFFSDEKLKKDKEFEKLISNILNSQYKREKEKDYLMHNDKRKVNLSNASSGQQEILPLLIILQILKRISFSGDGSVLYIEEPEAHLSPNAQKLVVKLFARLFNTDKISFQMIITTHSPYILSSFNNLMYAGNLVSEIKENETKVFKVIPQSEIIKPNEVFAYSLSSNKEIKSLIDSETSLISQNILDDVSNEISIEFGKLLDIEA
ncbi:AAA family ATPase [Labilibaculum euxinus]